MQGMVNPGRQAILQGMVHPEQTGHPAVNGAPRADSPSCFSYPNKDNPLQACPEPHHLGDSRSCEADKTNHHCH